jgi:hypothetical protein
VSTKLTKDDAFDHVKKAPKSSHHGYLIITNDAFARLAESSAKACHQMLLNSQDLYQFP